MKAKKGHGDARHRLRHLGAVGQQLDELKATYDRLQVERTLLVQQQHLLSSLADVLGLYRAAIHDEDCMENPAAELEQMLLQQLTTSRLPGLAVSDSCSSSSDCSSSSEPADVDDICSNDAANNCKSRPLLPVPATFSSGHAPGMEQGCSSVQCQVSSSVQHPLGEPVCPETDPFQLLHAIYSQPLDPWATEATLPQLAAKWAADVQLLSGYLQQLETAGCLHTTNTPAVIAPAESCSSPAMAAPAARTGGRGPGSSSSSSNSSSSGAQQQPAVLLQHPLECIKELQLGMFGVMQSLSLTNKQHLVFELQLINWFTGERSQEPCRQRHAAAVEALQLTAAQQQRLAAGWRLFQGLLNPIVTERKQLHQLGLQLPPGAAGSSSLQAASETNHAGTGAGARSSISGVYAMHSDHGARLQQQREQVARLRMLARKDTLLRGAMAAYMQGCLSWAQQAKLRVVMSPYHVNAGIFFVALMEHMQQEQHHNSGQRP